MTPIGNRNVFSNPILNLKMFLLPTELHKQMTGKLIYKHKLSTPV